jgi:hypothetical protein
VGGYYDLFLGFVQRAVDEGFLKARDQSLLLVRTELNELLQKLEAFEPDLRAVPAKVF